MHPAQLQITHTDCKPPILFQNNHVQGNDMNNILINQRNTNTRPEVCHTATNHVVVHNKNKVKPATKRYNTLDSSQCMKQSAERAKQGVQNLRQQRLLVNHQASMTKIGPKKHLRDQSSMHMPCVSPSCLKFSNELKSKRQRKIASNTF